MKSLFDKVSSQTSQLVTSTYSTSFTLGTRLLHKSVRKPIYHIYGFVRLADEIVDSFHEHDKKKLLDEFEASYYRALKEGISINPILNSFQNTVREYAIDDELVQAFLKSMRRDLNKQSYTPEEYTDYIYGSADAVGLMCLKVFVKGDETQYEALKTYAMALGSAFQKVNFLRDLKSDIQHLHRIYFPALREKSLDELSKSDIIHEIHADFEKAYIGIKKLPNEAKLGVYIAYLYYKKLLSKIERLPAQKVLEERIRISNPRKLYLAALSYIYYELKLI